jgi:glycerol kinase
VALLLALDQGTTSSRAILFDDEARVRGVAQREHPQSFPRPGWVEQDPEAVWQSQSHVAEQVLAEAGVRATDVAAVGISNQRETTVVWDRKTGAPVHPAIGWQDRRTADVCERLRADGLEPRVQATTGLRLDPYFSATKVRWILDHVAGARARAEAGGLAFGTIDAWLLHRLTGGRVHATDPTNASRTLLYDIHRGAWDDDLLQVFGVPRSMLPEVVPSCGVVAEARHGAPGVPVGGVAGDQQAALLGQACLAAGQAKTTYGTGCFLLLHTGTVAARSKNRLLTTAACAVDGTRAYALEGSVFTGGALVTWLRDGLGLIAKAADVSRLAATVPDNGGVVLVPAFAGLGAPHWDPHARGTIVGITQGTRAAHVARAALEAIALQVADVLDAMHADTGARLPELRVDGGAAVDDLLLQIQADVLGLPVVRPRVTETTALGAAFLAGLAVGVWKRPQDLVATWAEDRRFEPRMPRAAAQGLRDSWARAVERARGWATG